jgi:hypothetical protein
MSIAIKLCKYIHTVLLKVCVKFSEDNCYGLRAETKIDNPRVRVRVRVNDICR